MIMVIELTVSNISRGQRLEALGHNQTHYNSLKMQLMESYTIELECILTVCIGGSLRCPSASSYIFSC